MKIILVHWNEGESKERAKKLRGAGCRVERLEPGSGAALKGLRADAFLIDLSRLPSQGGAVATALRRQKATRNTPIVFVGGTKEKVARVRKLLPDATFTEWRRIRGALRKATGKPPESPVVPDTMAGYSGTPLPKKLGIKPGSTVALLGAPAGLALRTEAKIRRQARESDVILLFAKSRADLKRRFPAAKRAMADGGRLWICWRKKSSGAATDVAEADVRAFGLGNGLVDFKICAIDETWSGLCFVPRRK